MKGGISGMKFVGKFSIAFLKMLSLKIVLPFLLFFLVSCSVSHDPFRRQAHLLQKGRGHDDSSFVYQLPYEEGKKHRVIQGYFSRLSHKNRVAIDFKMKRGTNICAAREGVVVRVKEDGDRGGWNRKYRQYGNNIVIQHADGTRAGYWHLQLDGALVNVGDTVRAGQVIGLSGKTGYSALPHLHFMVWSSQNGQWTQVPTRFSTKKGPRYLRPLRKYKKPAANSADN